MLTFEEYRQVTLRQLWHYGNPEQWADKPFVGRNTSSSRHGYDGLRDNIQATTGRQPEESIAFATARV
jgi:hypothetical protein